MLPRTCALVLAVVAAVSLTACGESKHDKAKKEICSARGDIKSSIESLQSLTLSTGTLNQVRDDLAKIQKGLSTIRDKESDLDGGGVRNQVEAATRTFTTEVQKVVTNIGTNLSLSSAEAQVKAAGTNLLAAYEQALAPIDCG